MVSSGFPSATGALDILTNADVVACRQAVRRLTEQLGFVVIAQTMLVTAVSELARNTLIHGGGGTMSWEVVSESARRGIRLTFDDAGPGIPNIELAMTDGWTSKHGMGFGLPGAKRLVHEFEIASIVGLGTRVMIARWAPLSRTRRLPGDVGDRSAASVRGRQPPD